MTGLVLEGGGVRGSYQIGSFIALYDCGIKIDGFAGTSIGSFNAAMLASGKHYELLDFWENVDVAKLLNIKPLKMQDLDIEEIKASLSSYTKILKNKGIDVKSLLDVLDEILDVEALYESKKDFGLVTFRIKDLKPIYKFKEDIPVAKIKEYILASCYLPVFKQKKIIDGNYYFDGGIYDNSPVDMLLKKKYEKIYLVKLNKLIPKYIKENKNIIVIKPSRNLGGILSFNKENIQNNIKMGYYDTIRVLKNMDGFKFVFKNRSSAYYKFISRFVDQKLLKKIMKYFESEDIKEIIIKSLEYVMEKEKYDYYDIYNPYKIIKKIKKNKNSYFIYDFVRKLRKI